MMAWQLGYETEIAINTFQKALPLHFKSLAKIQGFLHVESDNYHVQAAID